jgi:hypothetical protein
MSGADRADVELPVDWRDVMVSRRLQLRGALHQHAAFTLLLAEHGGQRHLRNHPAERHDEAFHPFGTEGQRYQWTRFLHRQARLSGIATLLSSTHVLLSSRH